MQEKSAINNDGRRLHSIYVSHFLFVGRSGLLFNFWETEAPQMLLHLYTGALETSERLAAHSSDAAVMFVAHHRLKVVGLSP